jgi:pyruvate-formate lyase-activating enzyme
VKEDYQQLLEMWREEKKRRQEVEGENTIIKGIGNNSPEMKALQARVKELDNSLAIALEINDKHQRYNGKLQTRLTEVEEDNKKLSKQIEDKEDVVHKLRKKGLM